MDNTEGCNHIGHWEIRLIQRGNINLYGLLACRRCKLHILIGRSDDGNVKIIHQFFDRC